MSLLSLIHVALGLMAVAIGFVILGLRKGDPRHRVLGWAYAGCLVAGLTSIIVQGLSHPTPFHGYAALMMAGVIAAILASRFRKKIVAWRTWHGALMSMSLLGAVIAIGGVIGGLALGAGRGPVYYRMFNGVIVIFTGIGLWIINTRPVIWGRQPPPEHRRVRLWFTAAVITMSGALVLAQWIFSR
ncbi:MAG TPA: hypothetical protein VFN26_16150 [Candidatus Acidoferrum sp.]|nr:hypothetical protein [Candidatus Acidoferrum sp.]